ncbi:MAG: aryl-sulfate sulfotransferase, partial [Deltaproteobacteria bacterium]|nr:aryl-sulfate sulfotransferase [Deltaproteobacteria bacterium]
EEWTHGNSCIVLPDGNIMTTFLSLNTIAIINKSTGDFIWRWGQGELAHPHDPTILDNGNILVFDNGAHRHGEIQSYSRVLEVNPKTNEIEWEYKGNPSNEFVAAFLSGAQRLPNGNTLICEGPSGRIFEVTAEKELVWDFINPFYHPYPILGHSNIIFRAYRYGPDYEGFKGTTLYPESSIG